jgi:hypothetical protein
MYEAKRDGKNRVRHCVVEDAQEQPVLAVVRERRASVRCRCQLPVRVRFPGDDSAGEWRAVIHDVSAHGLGLRCDAELPETSLLTVELVSSRSSRALLARVVRKEPRDSGWFYGCELTQTLREEELRSWGTEVAVCT